jgi:hypothetical protein
VVKIGSESITGTDRLLLYETVQGTASGHGVEGRIRSPPEGTPSFLRNATAGVRLLYRDRRTGMSGGKEPGMGIRHGGKG